MTILYTVSATAWAILLIATAVSASDGDDLGEIAVWIMFMTGIATIIAIVSIEIYVVLGGV